MEMFSILDCEVLWNKRTKIPKRHRYAIKKDLKTMSAAVWEAMKFTKDRAVENRETVIKYWLNTDTPVDYILSVHYEPSFEAWYAGIEDENTVAEITSEKFRIFYSLQDEDVEKEPIK
jgi:hypothetical protein